MTSRQTKYRLVLLDIHAIVHRAYHALPDFTTSRGEPTGALYGVVSMLVTIIKELRPEYMVACFDLPKPTFRHKAYAAYKAGRPKAKDDLVYQIARTRDLLHAFNIPIYEAEGFEADDVIGTIVYQLKEKKDIEIVIASGDMDTLQLVDDRRVMVFTLKKGIKDTVLYDEEAVVKRFGFSPRLLPDYKGLRGDPSDNIIGVAGIGEKTATALIKTFGSIEEIYKILHSDEDALRRAGFSARVIKLLREGEDEARFSKMLATIRTDAPITFTLPKASWSGEVDLKKLAHLFDELEFRTMLARVTDALGRAVEDDSSNKFEQDVDPRTLKEMQIALWLIDSEQTSPTLEDIYAHTGAHTVREARAALEREIAALGLEEVYRNIELPLIPIIERAEQRGICVDLEHFQKLSKKYHQLLTKLERRIWKYAGHEFNINSPKQLAVVLFDELGLSVKGLKKTAGGARSTRESELVKLRDAHPIIGSILEYREIQKLVSAYIDTIPKLVDDQGRIHTHLNQTGTTTGRMSSSNPNLQNIPARGEVGPEIRRGFISSKGCVFFSFDYSQIEMRVLAHLSGDERLIEVFQKGLDVHTAVAMHVFGVSEREVTKDMRRRAKVINFGIVYGMGVNALRENLGTTRSEAKEFYDNFFGKFPRVRAYFDSVREEVRGSHYTRTLFGRIRRFDAITSPVPYIRAAAERMAINAPIQGTAADIIKRAMVFADQRLSSAGVHDETGLVLQIHDELIYDVHKDDTSAVVREVRKAMECDAAQLDVPLVVNVLWGKTLGDLQEYDGDTV